MFLSSLTFLGINLTIAQRENRRKSEQLPSSPPSLSRQKPLPPAPPLPGQMRFSRLLPLVVLLGVGIGVMVIYHGQIAISHWHPNLTVYGGTSRIPIRFRPEVFWQVGQQMATQPWQWVGLGLGAIALLIYPQPLLWAIALLMSLGFGLVLSEHWTEILPFFNPTEFDLVEPVFNRNVSFYIFQLPIWELMGFWFVGLSTLTLVSVLLSTLLANKSLSQGKFPGFRSAQLRHLHFLGGCLMLAIALSYWLARYELLYSPLGVAYGASFTDTTVRLPADTVLSLTALVLAIILLGRSLLWQTPQPQPRQLLRLAELSKDNGRSRTQKTPSPVSLIQSVRPYILYSLVSYVIIAVIAAFLLPGAVQRLVVQPDELRLEIPFIERAIALTREAFDLNEIEEETFVPQDNLTFDDIQENELTVKNIRVWDTRPLLETNRQLQRIRPYYEFPGADIDRYTILSGDEAEQQQVLISARELDYTSVPAAAQTWVNQHLIYTHGYGFTLSPVNTAGEGGLPDYFIRGIEMTPSSDRIRNSIPIGQPRIYYGELTNTYVMTDTEIQELDYPSGSENVYNTYDGSGGVSIGQFWQRLIFAKYLRDWRMLLTDNFNDSTQLLFRRNIGSRVRAIAPFLRYDADPYLVVADAGDLSWENAGRPANPLLKPPEERNYLYWVIDAYTTSDRYPYSDPLDNDFNYIRNSIKVVIDAYHGYVTFFVADERDPIINTWSKIFPGMFRPLSEMPPSLQAHIRYPQDFFRVQSDELMVYHMTDPQVFYNREDQWRAPTEIYGEESQLVAPYYLIMKLPAEDREEFILLRPFTPNQRTNLIAWLAARSDDVYQRSLRERRSGKMLLYRFPKQELVFGPEQIEARINQDPVISQRISLWNQRGSSAVQGNLLVIPIEQSLLYVEPLYLEATINRLPILARVITAYENRIVMAETLNDSLRGLFQPTETTETIIRELEGEDPALQEETTPPLLEDEASPILREEAGPPP